MNLMNGLARQGDVLLQTVAVLPEGAQPLPLERGRVVLQHGESTGHAHAIASPRAMLYAETGSGSGGRRFLVVAGDASVDLVHEEHDTISVPAGVHEILLPSEYVAPEVVRQVVD